MTINTVHCNETKKCNNVATIICPPAGPSYPCADLSIYDQSLSDNCEDSSDNCQSSETNPVSSSNDNVPSCDESNPEKEHKNKKEKKCQSASNFSNSSVANDKFSSPTTSNNHEKVKSFSLTTCHSKNQNLDHKIKHNLKLEDCCNNNNRVILKLKKGKSYNFDCKLESSGYKIGFSYDPCDFKQINDTPLMSGDGTFTLDTTHIKSYGFLMSEENPKNRILVLIKSNKSK